MLTVVGDTHRSEGHGLTGRTREAVRSAETVLHVGDFTTIDVYDALAAESAELHAVTGNNDETALEDRLPTRTVFEAEGLTVTAVHGHEHATTALVLLGRETGADVVIFGHSHRPSVDARAAPVLLNPGSHADPRWYRPAHAEIERGVSEIEGRLVEPDGAVFETFHLPDSSESS